MSWMQKNIIVFDVETTGLDPEKDRIVQLAIVHFCPGKRWAEMEAWVTLAHPVVDISAGAALVHSFEPKELEKHPPLEKKIKGILKILSRGDVFVAYNAPFDISFIEATARRAGVEDALPFNSRNVVDPLVLSRGLYPAHRGHKLAQVAARLGVLSGVTHDALWDSMAAADVLIRMAMREKLPEDLEALITLQEKYREAWDRAKKGWRT